MTDDEFSRVFALAGLDKSEVRRDPEHGFLISASGVRKLAAATKSAGIAGDRAKIDAMLYEMALAEQRVRSRKSDATSEG